MPTNLKISYVKQCIAFPFRLAFLQLFPALALPPLDLTLCTNYTGLLLFYLIS